MSETKDTYPCRNKSQGCEKSKEKTNISAECFYVMSEVTEDIKKNFCTKLSLKEYANKYFMSESYFSKNFKTYTGMSFTEYIRNLKFDKARALLATTSLSVLEIALKLGYDDYYHFSKQFKRLYSVSPSEYRKQNIGLY